MTMVVIVTVVETPEAVDIVETDVILVIDIEKGTIMTAETVEIDPVGDKSFFEKCYCGVTQNERIALTIQFALSTPVF